MALPTDNFAGSPAFSVGADFPATKMEDVTPSDTVFLTTVSRALYVGVSGDLTVVPRDGDGTTGHLIKAAAVGYHPLRVLRVNATATTATNIVSLS
jgi:hypothetical protein